MRLTPGPRLTRRVTPRAGRLVGPARRRDGSTQARGGTGRRHVGPGRRPEPVTFGKYTPALL